MPQKPTQFDIRSQWLRSIAFVVGFCVMTIELISGRLMAPYLGNSLYTWTAVLTSVLAAIAIGSYVGGKLSGKKTMLSEIWFWLGGSALILLMAIFPAISFFGPLLQASDLPIVVLTLFFSFFIFFPPAFSLAIITPLLVKTDVQSLEESGSSFGSLAAWNAGGSMLGTYATGFFFISYLQTSHIILTVAAVLFAGAIGAFFFTKKAFAV